MDRRQVKTRIAIFSAFKELLKKKRYEAITVQEIIDRANVGRSTFYAHFETKELLLDALCEDLFYHIFEKDPCHWVDKDGDLEGKLSHILWHIREDKDDLIGILRSDSAELFMNYFKKHLRVVFKDNVSVFKTDVPLEFLLNHLVGSFYETVMWWVKEGMKTSSEITVGYFMKMTEKH